MQTAGRSYENYNSASLGGHKVAHRFFQTVESGEFSRFSAEKLLRDDRMEDGQNVSSTSLYYF